MPEICVSHVFQSDRIQTPHAKKKNKNTNIKKKTQTPGTLGVQAARSHTWPETARTAWTPKVPGFFFCCFSFLFLCFFVFHFVLTCRLGILSFSQDFDFYPFPGLGSLSFSRTGIFILSQDWDVYPFPGLRSLSFPRNGIFILSQDFDFYHFPGLGFYRFPRLRSLSIPGTAIVFFRKEKTFLCLKFFGLKAAIFTRTRTECGHAMNPVFIIANDHK